MKNLFTLQCYEYDTTNKLTLIFAEVVGVYSTADSANTHAIRVARDLQRHATINYQGVAADVPAGKDYTKRIAYTLPSGKSRRVEYIIQPVANLTDDATYHVDNIGEYNSLCIYDGGKYNSYDEAWHDGGTSSTGSSMDSLNLEIGGSNSGLYDMLEVVSAVNENSGAKQVWGIIGKNGRFLSLDEVESILKEARD